MTTSHRRSDDDIRQFEAPSSLAQNLQERLVDLMTNGIYAAVSTIRIHSLEEQAWMLKSEKRKG
jgi:hypothetical protein